MSIVYLRLACERFRCHGLCLIGNKSHLSLLLRPYFLRAQKDLRAGLSDPFRS